MRLLMRAGANAEVVEAFNINYNANKVYQHDFGHRPYQGNIQSLTVADLDCYGADAWLLSPPCQPYTQQGLHKQSGEAWAFSFLNILELIPHTHLDLRWCYLWKMLSDLRSILGSFILIEGIHIESVTVWCTLFQATLFLPGKKKTFNLLQSSFR